MPYSYEEKVPHSKTRRKYQRLLSLDELEREIKPQSVGKMKLKNVQVDKIIGTENRSEDFGEDFLPIARWMDERWLHVKEVWASGDKMDPIVLIEYGGYYFVRDGHHRISIAKAELMKSVSARVIEHKIPIKLNQGMTRQLIPAFVKKYKFQKDTELFDVLPEKNFDVRIPENWDKLKFNIFRMHKQWMIERDGKAPGKTQLILDWNIEVYEDAVAEIGRNKLSQLYPKLGITDIFCELMDYWEDNPDWASSANRELMGEVKRQRPFRMLWYRIIKFFAFLRKTADEEKYRFLWITRLLDKRPNAVLPEGGKRWYNFLTRHLLGYYRYHHRKKHGKNPKMDELAGKWYDDWFLPAQKIYNKLSTDIPFPDFYMEWMGFWKREILKGNKPGLKKSFEKFLESKKIGKPKPDGEDFKD
jgi:hypothetical protein